MADMGDIRETVDNEGLFAARFRRDRTRLNFSPCYWDESRSRTYAKNA